MDLRVMNAVHAWRNDHLAENALQADRQPPIAMMKDHLAQKGDLVGGKRPG